MITLYSMAIPNNNLAWVEAICPYINGAVDCSPNIAMPYHHGWHPAGWWDQQHSTYTRTLTAGSVVQWGYYNYDTLSVWAHDTYTALEIIKIK